MAPSEVSQFLRKRLLISHQIIKDFTEAFYYASESTQSNAKNFTGLLFYACWETPSENTSL